MYKSKKISRARRVSNTGRMKCTVFTIPSDVVSHLGEQMLSTIYKCTVKSDGSIVFTPIATF